MPEPDDGIGTLYVEDMTGDTAGDPGVFIRAVDPEDEECPWLVASMYSHLGPGEAAQWEGAKAYAERLVRCFEACRGVPDEVLKPGCVADLIGEPE